MARRSGTKRFNKLKKSQRQRRGREKQSRLDRRDNELRLPEIF